MYLILCVLTFCVILVLTNAETNSASALKIHKEPKNTTDPPNINHREHKPLVWKLSPTPHFAYRYQEDTGIYRGLQYNPRSAWARLAKVIPFVREAHMDKVLYENIDRGLEHKIDKRHKPIFLVSLRKHPLVHRVQNIEEAFDMPREMHKDLRSSLLNVGLL